MHRLASPLWLLPLLGFACCFSLPDVPLLAVLVVALLAPAAGSLTRWATGPAADPSDRERAARGVAGGVVALTLAGLATLELLWPGYPLYAPHDFVAALFLLPAIGFAVAGPARAAPRRGHLAAGAALAVAAVLAALVFASPPHSPPGRCLPLTASAHHERWRDNAWGDVWGRLVAGPATEAEAAAVAACLGLPEITDYQALEGAAFLGRPAWWSERAPARAWAQTTGDGMWTEDGGCVTAVAWEAGWVLASDDCGSL